MGAAGVARPTLIGRSVGNYRVDRRLGAGAMGEVYLLQHVTLPNTFAALKVLRADTASVPYMKERFVQEALVAAAVGSEHVARPLDIGKLDDGSPYILLEYAAGRTLAQELESNGPLSVTAALRIIHRVADTMAQVHAAGIVHRDLKPSNLMLDDDIENPRVKILDFGVARAPAELRLAETVENAIIGSPGFMSPEAATGGAIAAKADVFSLGATLYRCLTPNVPFPKTSAIGVAALLAEPAPTIAANRPANLDAAPDPLESLVSRMLEKTPSARPTMAEVRDAIGAMADVPAELRTRTEPTAAIHRDDLLGSTITSGKPAVADLGAIRARLEAICDAKLSSITPKRSPRRRIAIAVAALAVTAIATSALILLTRHHTSANPIAHGVTIACPIFDARGTDEPSGWLGAAAAQVACRQLWLRYNAADLKVLTPGDLLDLPRVPTEGFPNDPFVASDARVRARAEAKKHARAVVDGVVEITQAGFRVELFVQTVDADPIGQGAGTGTTLPDAVQAALLAIPAHVFPIARGPSAELAKWTGITSPPGLDLFARTEYITGPGPEICKALHAGRATLGATTLSIAAECEASGVWPGGLPTREGLSEDLVTLWAGAFDAEFGPVDKLRGIASDLLRVRDAVGITYLEAKASWALAIAWHRLGEADRALDAALLAVRVDPQSYLGWITLQLIAGNGSTAFSGTSETSAWAAWRGYSWSMRGVTPEEIKTFSRRAYDLERDSFSAASYGRALIRVDPPERLRSFAATLPTRTPEQELARDYLFALFDASEGRFGRAAARLRARILVYPLGAADTPNHARLFSVAINLTISLTELAGDVQAFARELLEKRILAGEIPRDQLGGLYNPILRACMRAEPSLATTCLDFVAAMPTGTWVMLQRDELVQGGRKYLAGDLRGAADAWRPILASRNKTAAPTIVESVYASEPKLGELFDEWAREAPWFRGLPLTQPAMAKRALARGDKKRARELAQQVIDAWSSADVRVPAVDEMQTLLASMLE